MFSFLYNYCVISLRLLYIGVGKKQNKTDIIDYEAFKYKTSVVSQRLNSCLTTSTTVVNIKMPCPRHYGKNRHLF